jgi:hypothetical protein
MEPRILVPPGAGDIASLFRPGEILQGKILQSIDSCHAMVEIKGRTLRVETRVPLPEGFSGLFEVESIAPPVTLRLLGGSGGEAPFLEGLLRRHLSSDAPLELLANELSEAWTFEPEQGVTELQKGIERLAKAFQAVSIEDFSLDSEGLLRVIPGAIERSGLFFEGQIRRLLGGDGREGIEALLENDLKSLALRLTRELELLLTRTAFNPAKAASAKRLLKGLEHLVQKIELYQIFNLTHFEDGTKLLLIPVWLGGEFQFVELGLSLSPSGQRQESRGISLLFLLQLPDLGRMRIEVTVKEKGLFATFVVFSEEVATWVDQGLGELGQKLRQAGFEPNLRVSVETPEAETSSLIGDMAAEGPFGFSVIV